ncbi:MAG: hypothetical protein JNM56_30060 [Planctomycetia bacterium]|nr:hypothetical protein [Planctomycetia bacterium]
MSLQRWLFGLVCFCTAALLAASADAQTAAKKENKKTTTAAKKDDKKSARDEQELTKQILSNLETWFKQHDLNNDDYLDLSEITKALGIGSRAADYRKADTDTDKRVSKAEHDAWAQDYAPKLAEEIREDEEEAKAAIEKYQQALAKATAQAKQQYQQAIERQREQLQRARDRNRFNDRFRRDRNRRR